MVYKVKCAKTTHSKLSGGWRTFQAGKVCECSPEELDDLKLKTSVELVEDKKPEVRVEVKKKSKGRVRKKRLDLDVE